MKLGGRGARRPTSCLFQIKTCMTNKHKTRSCCNILSIYYFLCYVYVKCLLPMIVVGVGGHDRQNLLPDHFRVLHGLMKVL